MYNTRFSKSELTLLHHIANGTEDVSELSRLMGVSETSVYNAARGLRRKGVLSGRRGFGISADAASVRLTLMMRDSAGRAALLSDSGIPVLTAILEPRTAEEVMALTALSRATVFRKLGLARRMGAAILDDSDRYVINDRAWRGLREMLLSLADKSEVVDPRVKSGSEIYRISSDEVLFSNPSELDAQKAAFSRFSDYGIDVILDTIYYTSSDESQSLNKIFLDSFLIAEKTMDFRLRMGVLIFYATNKTGIDRNSGPASMMRRIESGESIARWPTLDDIRDRIPGFGSEDLDGQPESDGETPGGDGGEHRR